MDSLPLGTPEHHVLSDELYALQLEEHDHTDDAEKIRKGFFELEQELIVKPQLEYARQHFDMAGYALLMDNIRNASGCPIPELIRPDVHPMFDIFFETYEK
ncbi:MAG: hypothetical protein LBH06_04285 [Rikenellaceae bacterium]|nr:hypothetical protein [Rikenellaceae bacterium]